MAEYDYIIVGGGIAGCTLASRLRQKQPEKTILLVEAGGDVTGHPHVEKPADGAALLFSSLDWKYFTVPQPHLDNKPRYNAAGKGLSGGSIINTGGWIRGDKLDYDAWAREVGDERWGYEGLLPYFKKTETREGNDAGGVDKEQHGFDGPVKTVSTIASGRTYPLREHVLKLWENLSGIGRVEDANNGHPQGIANLVESFTDGKRQLTSAVYSLDGVDILLNTLVRRVVFEGNVAVGIALAGGEVRKIRGGGEVIVSAGAYRTPQILLLSGIGDAAYLTEQGIPVVIDLPDVGKNLSDHMMLLRYWKLLHPERGLSLGSPLFGGPDSNYDKGGPTEWLVTTPIPHGPLKSALEKDSAGLVQDDHPLLKGPRSHLEMNVIYAVYGAEALGLQIPLDGSSITTFCMGCLPTSRGSVTLASTNPADPPVIDPNYYATETDRHVMREGYRMQSRLMFETPEGRELVKGEHVPEGFTEEELGIGASDESIDRRVKVGGSTVFHPSGTAAMGRVVDGDLRVKDVMGLRVVDASIIPQPLACHYQAVVYAIAEQAANIMTSET